MTTPPTLPATAGTPHINLLGFECGLHMGPPIVHAASGTELFGESFNDALKRIDEFTEPGRTLLLDLQTALERVAASHPRSPLLFRNENQLARRPASRSESSAPVYAGLAALRRIESRLRRAGADLPAPAAQGTVESAIVTGLSLALAIIDTEVNVMTHDAALAARYTGVRAAEIAQLLDDLERVGAKATGEMIGICSQAGAVINALLAGLSAEQLG